MAYQKTIRKKTIVEREFRKSADACFYRIEKLHKNLRRKEHKARLETIGDISENQEHGPHYETNILKYLEAVEEIRRNHERQISLIAKNISYNIRYAREVVSGKNAQNLRRDMWIGLASALEPLSARPSKKVAALLVDDKDNLIAWDGNHLCFGILPTAPLLAKNKHSHRGHHLWCAERNVITKFLGINAYIENFTLGGIHAAINHFTKTLAAAVIGHEDLGRFTLVSSHYPCGECAEVIAPRNPRGKGRLKAVKELIARWNHDIEKQLTNPSRKTGQSPALIRAADIRQLLRTSGPKHS